jgi:putative peptide zinc metalloprotease protein
VRPKTLATRLTANARAALSRARANLNQPREPHLERPRRVRGVELIGQYQDSGFKEPPYLVRRPDGQIVQLSRLLFLVAAEADGTRDLRQLATIISQRFGRNLSPDNVAALIDTKLRPAGLIDSHNGVTSQARRLDPLLALRHRAAVVPPAAVRAAARVLRPLFTPVLVGAALSWLVALDLWLGHHGMGSAVGQLIARPVLLLALLGLVIVSAVWHELGHATACTYGGATPGAMGVGLYVIWPAFYTDVTDAYRLRRGGRLRTDLGGVYFNALFALAAGGAYFATRFEPLLALVAVQHFQIVQQLTPVMRLDGYYVVTDLVGVPDILSRLKPLLLSFLPFRAPDRRVSELKPWVRGATSAYILLFIIGSVTLLVLVGLSAPHLLPAAVQSAEVYSHRAATAWHRHELAAAALAEIQVLSVMLPAVGLALGAIRLLRRVVRRVTSFDRRLKLALGTALAGVVGFGWPFLLWGLRPGMQARSARASIHSQAPRNASGRRHAPHVRPGGRGVPRTNALSTAATSTPSPPKSGTALSARWSAGHATTGAGSAVASTATAASGGGPSSGYSSSGTGSGGSSSTPTSASSGPVSSAAGTPATTSTPTSTSTPNGSGSTTSGANGPSTTTTTTAPSTQTTTTSPTSQTSTTSPSG